MTDEERIDRAALELHAHRFGERDRSSRSWAISRRAAWLALDAAGAIGMDWGVYKSLKA